MSLNATQTSVGVYDSSRVHVAHGKSRISMVVNKGLAFTAKAWNEDTEELETVEGTTSYRMGRVNGFVSIPTHRPRGNGRSVVGCGENQRILTPAGWRRAADLRVGDEVMQSVSHHLSQWQMDLIRGTLMGDGCLDDTHSDYATRLRWSHCSAQEGYSRWKMEMLSTLPSSWEAVRDDGVHQVEFHGVAELTALRRSISAGHLRKRFSREYLEALTPLGLALWYMDDSNFFVPQEKYPHLGYTRICIKAMTPETWTVLQDVLKRKFDLTTRLWFEKGAPNIETNSADTHKLHRLIAPYVHPDLQYKLHPEYRGRFRPEPSFSEARDVLLPTPVLEAVRVDTTRRSSISFGLDVGAARHPLFEDLVLEQMQQPALRRRADAGVRELRVSKEDRKVLEGWLEDPGPSRKPRTRAGVVLGVAAGRKNSEIAKELGCTTNTVSTWAKRYQAGGIEALKDRPRNYQRKSSKGTRTE